MTIAQLEVIKSGAPSKITPMLLAKAKAFVDGEWTKYNRTVPTVEGLAIHLGLYRTYLYECQDLSDTMEQIQRLQSSMLIDGGLNNEMNPSIVKLLLSAKHGYVEKTEVANSHSIVAEPQQAIATDFSAYVKNKTVAVEGEIATPTLPDSTTE